jgi:hypothetical protein
VRRHDLKNEAEAEEDSATPPAHRGEEISCLPDSNQSVRRRAGSAKACSEPATLAALKEDAEDQHEAIEDEQYEQKVVKH